MIATTLTVAASSFFALSIAAPIRTGSFAVRSLVERADYKDFTGDGSVGAGWPAQSAWKDFESLWSANLDIIKSSCAGPGWGANDNDAEVSAIKDALTSVATESQLPSQFLLAIMMQESKGCVRVPTTNYGVNNPGLMQSFDGKTSCAGASSCSSDQIKSMISEGAGVGSSYGLQQALAKAGGSTDAKWYRTARAYNSGENGVIEGNLGGGIATHCYSSDIANRLVGWAGDSSPCNENTIGNVGSGGSTTTTTEPAKGTDSTTTPTTTPTTTGTDASGPKAAGASSTCKSWYTVKSGDTCSSAGVDFAKLRELNTSLDANCSNLIAGTSYCVSA